MTGPDFVVLTGFLGSGKTTLLRDYLARPEAAGTGVIVNEAGEIGLDGAILREGKSGLNVAMLANGCVCCQLGSDLADSVFTLLDAAPLQRIVLETSGLSKPGPVLRQLAGLSSLGLRASVLATYDALRGTAISDFAEAAAQWAAANRIVATRMDAVEADGLEEAAAAIAGLNPLAEVVADMDRAQAVSAAFAPLPNSVSMPAPRPVTPQPHPQIAVRLARPSRMPSYDELATWLDNLAGALGERLLRIKGVMRVRGDGPPLLIQSVGTLFSAPRPFPAGSGPCFLVLIVRDLDGRELDAVAPAGLFEFTRQSEPDPFARPRTGRGRMPLPELRNTR